jgi:DNA-binding NarL/FixJ family response regulator
MEILFVDDELDRIEQFIQDIEIAAKERGREIPKVEKINSLDVAYKHIIDHIDIIEVLVLDIMMPGGERFYRPKEDPLGLKCGFYFYQAIREEYPNLKIRIFTNVDDPEILMAIAKDKNALLMLKDETLPFELTSNILHL